MTLGGVDEHFQDMNKIKANLILSTIGKVILLPSIHCAKSVRGMAVG